MNTNPSADLAYFDPQAFARVVNAPLSRDRKTALFADMARLNVLYMIQLAGSGHLGSSFSSMDIVSWLYLNALGPSDRYFSSKGHDVPGLYAVQLALGIIPFEKIHLLRRLGGLPGHPDVAIPGTYTNTGSLGMGVSKAKGFLYADKLLGRSKGRVFVMVGDGELQEGQFWESLLSIPRIFRGDLTIIVDHNKIQSDTHVSNVSHLGDLSGKFEAFGLETVSIDGHNYKEIERVLGTESMDLQSPDVIIANTIKGRGISFLEHTAMKKGQLYYPYHSGALSKSEYLEAKTELLERISRSAEQNMVQGLQTCRIKMKPLTGKENRERMIPEYSKAIVEEASKNPNIVALDADLVLDTGLIPFKERFPERFIECGIAEQDMVSQAGTMALSGLLPIVHSFSCFLTARASEQIYNNCTERSKIIYVGSLSGILPGGPGHSHQSLRDITAMSARPGMVIVEPINANMVEPLFQWAARENPYSTYIRLTSIPYISDNLANIPCPSKKGRGEIIFNSTEPNQIVLISTGPIMTHLALSVAERLNKTGIPLIAICTVWHNAIDVEWYRTTLADCKAIITFENHFSERGFGSWFISALAASDICRNAIVKIIGVDKLPVCGSENEVLEHHGLTCTNIEKILLKINKK